MSTRPTGRPTLLDDELADKICQLLSKGNYFKVACQANGISADTGHEWRNRGTPGTREYDERGPYSAEQTEAIQNGHDIPLEDALYARFAHAIALAEAAAEVHAVEVLHKGMEDDPRWAVEYLKRKHPDRWREETRIDASIESSTEHRVVITSGDAQLLDAIAAMERAGMLSTSKPAGELEAGEEGDDDARSR